MSRRHAPPARGAALLVAMVLLSVVATLATGMVWQQWKAVQVETAERARVQTAWILAGALDWARLILREDARSGRATSLNEPWATPLAEARLSTFLAVDRDHNADEGPDAFLSGAISDAQARYNLRNLIVDGKVLPAQLAILQRLCSSAGVDTATAGLLADGLRAAATGEATAALEPVQWADLAWMGVDATSLNEPWATPLAEARLSTFLAVDRDHNADEGPDAFLSGAISDAQARYNLRNLVVDGKVVPAQLAILQRLCTSVGVDAATASLLADGLRAAATGEATAALEPVQWADLAWMGVDATSLQRLSGVAVLLPVATPVNLNTASREVLAGVVAGLDLGGADRLVQSRARQPFRNLGEASQVLGAAVPLGERDVGVKSAYFEIRGRLRLEQRVQDVMTLVERQPDLRVVAIARQRLTGLSPVMP